MLWTNQNWQGKSVSTSLRLPKSEVLLLRQARMVDGEDERGDLASLGRVLRRRFRCVLFCSPPQSPSLGSC